ncbi:MAG: helical backbone metal receptor [Gemmatimonadetes bacterium]|nr:helical backbone metal receptor [Gemmatimonadota bacterium]
MSPPRTAIHLVRSAALAALLALGACAEAAPDASASSSASPPIAVVDDAGDTLRLASPAERIVSLAPNATETLVAIGALPQLVGRSDYDTGLGVDAVASVGGGLDPSLERLVALRPDLVIGWHSAGANPVRDRLREMGIPYLAVRTTDTADVFRTIGVLGRVTGRDSSADSVAAAVRAQLQAVRASVAGRAPRTAFYVVGDEPLMTAGPRTFTVQLMEVAGGRTAFPDVTGQPQYVSMEELVRRQPEVILLPVGEGGAARVAELAKRPGWRELNAFRAGRVHALPADRVNRMGPGIGETARRFRDALHPDLAGR